MVAAVLGSLLRTLRWLVLTPTASDVHVQAADGEVGVQPDAQVTSDGVGEGKEPENSTKSKRNKTSDEEDAPTHKKQKKITAGSSVDVSQIVAQALGKKGGTAKLQKLLSIVTKKLAKHDVESVDKDSTLAKVQFSNSRKLKLREFRPTPLQGLLTTVCLLAGPCCRRHRV